MKKYDKLLWLCFITERITFYFLFPLDWNFAYQRMQNLDIAALRTDFWVSLYNLHMQPPLFNVFVGMIAKFIPEAYSALAVQTIYFILAILAFKAIRSIISETVESEFVRKLVEIGYLIFPTILFSERWFAYTFPVACGILWCAYFLLRYDRTSRVRYFTAFSILSAVIVLTRSFFHPLIWLIPMLGITFVVKKEHWRVRLVIAFTTILIASAPNFVNYKRYGIFASSTWQGMNLFNSLRYISGCERENLIKSEKMSPLCRLGSCAHPEQFIQSGLCPELNTTEKISVLDDLEKSSSPTNLNGEINWNHRIIPFISKELQKSWLNAIRAYPLKYAQGVSNAAYLFFTIDVYHYWDNTKEWLPQSTDSFSQKTIKITKAFLVPLFFFALYITSFLGFLLYSLSRKDRIFHFFCLANLVYVLGLSVVGELGENSIMRVPIDALMIVGTGLFINKIHKST